MSVYDQTLEWQLGPHSPLTVRALIAPPDDNASSAEIYGWLESNTYNANKDAGNVVQRKSGTRFVTADVPDVNIYENYTISFPDSGNRTYTIEYIDKDATGVQVLWLY